MSDDADIAYLFEEETADVVVFSDQQRHDLLGGIEQIGMPSAAAAELGITQDMLNDAMKLDSRLAGDIELAVGRYRANILRRTAELAFEGSTKAIVGGKNKDDIIGHDVIPNDTALKIITQMHFADDLAQVTRQRLTVSPVEQGGDSFKADFSKLERSDRRQLERLIKKAKNLTEKDAEEKMKEREKDGE